MQYFMILCFIAISQEELDKMITIGVIYLLTIYNY